MALLYFRLHLGRVGKRIAVYVRGLQRIPNQVFTNVLALVRARKIFLERQKQHPKQHDEGRINEQVEPANPVSARQEIFAQKERRYRKRSSSEVRADGVNTVLDDPNFVPIFLPSSTQHLFHHHEGSLFLKQPSVREVRRTGSHITI